MKFKITTPEQNLLFSRKLNNIEWNNFLCSNDVSLNFNTRFLNKIDDKHSECFPIKTKFISEKRLRNPWVTPTVIRSIKNYTKITKLVQYLNHITTNIVIP